MGNPENGCCAYCGGSFGSAEPKIVNELKYDPRGAGRFADPEMVGSKHRAVQVAICGNGCTDLKRFTDRRVFTAILGADRIAHLSDAQLQAIGRGRVQPYYEVRSHGDVPAEPWKGHVDALELRVAIAAVELDIDLVEPQRHPSQRGCGVCSIAKSPDGWRTALVGGYPICRDCEAERLVSGNMAAGRRLRALFAGQLNKILPIDSDTLRCFMETDLVRTHGGGFDRRFGYVNAEDREKLKALATNMAWRSVPSEWVDRYKRQPAPVKAPAPLGAVGV